MSTAIRLLTPSTRMPPWMRLSKTGPDVSTRETSHEAIMSPTDSTVVTTKAMSRGMTDGLCTEDSRDRPYEGTQVAQ